MFRLKQLTPKLIYNLFNGAHAANKTKKGNKDEHFSNFIFFFFLIRPDIQISTTFV